MNCHKCNEKVGLFDKFCPSCGEKIINILGQIKNKLQTRTKENKPLTIPKEFTYIVIALILAGTYILVENQKINYKEKLRLEQEQEKVANENSRGACLVDALNNYSAFWDQTCKGAGKKPSCSLYNTQSSRVDKSYKEEKDECYKKYPVLR